MTTIIKVKKKCAVCGTTDKYSEMVSTTTFGLPDLDTRPPEMKRSSIGTWVQTCASCGYCAPDISKRLEKSPEVVYSDFYQQQLKNLEFPELTNAFLCLSLIYESAGDYLQAGWECVHAAWACDDADSVAGAQKCRKKAVTLFQKAKENGQEFAQQAGVEEAVMVDLLRRSGQFESALRMCDEGLKKNPKRQISDILRFQKMLAGKSDMAGHSIAEIT